MSDAELLTVSVRCLPSHRLSSGHRPEILRGDTKVLGHCPLVCSLAIRQTLNYGMFLYAYALRIYV